ncbi:MAG: hypothetical protein ACI4EK_03815 [Wujia sp.]
MKSKLAGFFVLLLVILAGSGYYLYQNHTTSIRINGYLGGEKIGLFEDEEVQKILKKEYQVEFDYSRAGSLDMVTADLSGRDYLFPSSQTALEYYKDIHGNALSDEIIFNTPIVLYSHKPVVDALIDRGVVRVENHVYYADMAKMTELILTNTQWSDLGLKELYGSVSIDTTDPARSNSGNMFVALLANVLNDGKTVTAGDVQTVLPDLRKIFSRLGYMETSSSDLFNQFLRMGVGAKPIIAGYENQLLEYAAQMPKEYAKIKDDILIIYPSPTVWSTHVYIALDKNGKLGMDAMLDEKIQKLAWKKHGFRSNNYDAAVIEDFQVKGVPEDITQVMNMPEYAVMKELIDNLQ